MFKPNKRVQRFRAEQIRHGIPGYYSGIAHGSFTLTTSLAVTAYAISNISVTTAFEWLWFPFFFIYTNLVEYAGHRWVMHRHVRFLHAAYFRHVLQHHRYFDANNMSVQSDKEMIMVLFPLYLVLFFGGLIGTFSWFIVVILFGPNAAWILTTVSALYFLNYEVLHTLYHLPRQHALLRWPVIKSLSQRHTNHHNPTLMSKYNFNITYPIGDWLFGTLNAGEVNAKQRQTKAPVLIATEAPPSATHAALATPTNDVSSD